VLTGRETVDGVSTSHYTATVDLRRLAALETDPVVSQSLRRAIELSGTTTYPVDVWIDGDGFLRRMRTTQVEAPPDAPGTVVTVTATEELSAFGIPAQVAVPPASDVADLADLTG
jgi:hexokinase